MIKIRSVQLAIDGQKYVEPNPQMFSRILATTRVADALQAGAQRPSLIWLPVIVLLAASLVALLWNALPTGLEIFWSVRGRQPASFNVYRAPADPSDGAEYTLIGELPAEIGVVDYGSTDLRLLPVQQFMYRIEAVDGSGKTFTSHAVPGNSLEVLPRQVLFIVAVIIASLDY